MITPSDLHVVLVLSNPIRSTVREQLFKECYARVKQEADKTRATVWIVEASFGERDHAVADASNPNHILIRCDHEVWIKEAMMNAAVRHFPLDWKYVLFMDADIDFVRKGWMTEIVHALQHYAVIQPFSHCTDLGPDMEPIEQHIGFAYSYVKGRKFAAPGYGTFWHPGYAWAWRRDAYECVGGNIATGLCGAGDHHMACALIGRVESSYPGNLHPNYAKPLHRWQDLAEKKIARNLGYIDGLILHHFHGPKASRNYTGRWEILRSNAFDPETDIVWDWQGMPKLAGNKPKLRDDLRAYFRARNEDLRLARMPS